MSSFKIGNLIATVPSVEVCGQGAEKDSQFPATYHPCWAGSGPCMRSYQVIGEGCDQNSCFTRLEDADASTLSQLKNQLAAAKKEKDTSSRQIARAIAKVAAAKGRR